MKQPDEKRIKSLYGDNKEAAKRYRKGWYNAGRVIQKSREKQK